MVEALISEAACDRLKSPVELLRLLDWAGNVAIVTAMGVTVIMLGRSVAPVASYAWDSS